MLFSKCREERTIAGWKRWTGTEDFADTSARCVVKPGPGRHRMGRLEQRENTTIPRRKEVFRVQTKRKRGGDETSEFRARAESRAWTDFVSAAKEKYELESQDGTEALDWLEEKQENGRKRRGGCNDRVEDKIELTEETGRVGEDFASEREVGEVTRTR